LSDDALRLPPAQAGFEIIMTAAGQARHEEFDAADKIILIRHHAVCGIRRFNPEFYGIK
jgi:hypothetical protein